MPSSISSIVSRKSKCKWNVHSKFQPRATFCHGKSFVNYTTHTKNTAVGADPHLERTLLLDISKQHQPSSSDGGGKLFVGSFPFSFQSMENLVDDMGSIFLNGNACWHTKVWKFFLSLSYVWRRDWNFQNFSEKLPIGFVCLRNFKTSPAYPNRRTFRYRKSTFN